MEMLIFAYSDGDRREQAKLISPSKIIYVEVYDEMRGGL